MILTRDESAPKINPSRCRCDERTCDYSKAVDEKDPKISCTRCGRVWLLGWNAWKPTPYSKYAPKRTPKPKEPSYD